MGVKDQLNRYLFNPADQVEKRLVTALDTTLKNIARPVARDGLKGLRAGVANFISPGTQRRPERRSYGYGSGLYSGMFGQWAAAYRQLPGTPTGLALAAETSEVIYNCLTVRMNAIAGLKWDIYPKAGERNSNTALRDTPFHRLHNYAMTEYGHNLFYLWELSLGVHGEVFFEKLVNDFGQPGGLRYLNRLGIDPMIFGGKVQQYTYSDDGGLTNFLPDEVVRHSYANALDDFSGSAPLSRALVAANIDRLLAKHILGYFANGARIGGVLTARANATISLDDFDERKKEFQEQLAGPENAYKTAILPFELEYTPYTNQPFDHQGELEDSVVNKMHWAMQVSPVLTGAVPASDPLSSLGTLDAAKAFFFESWVEPESKAISLVVNTIILPWLGMQDYELVFDVDKVLSTMRQTKEKSDRVQSEFKAMGLSYNEYRQQLGYDPDPLMDEMFWYENIGLVPKSEIPHLWKARLAIAPSVYNADIVRGEPLPAPVDPNAVVPDNTGGEAVADPATQAAAANADLTANGQPIDPTKDVATTPPTGKALYAGLSLANQPDLMQLQERVKQIVGEGECRWNTPDDFHVTLVYAPAATDEQAAQVKAALQSIDVPELALNVGSLGVFDHVGEHAVHFKLRSPGDLRDLQQQVYDLCQQAGVQTSSFHNPAAYIPHITMGYAAQKLKPIVYSSKLRVQPTELKVMYGDEVIFQKACGADDEPEPPAGKAVHDHDHTPTVQTFAPLDELRAWERKVKAAHKAGKAAGEVKFQPYQIRDEIADGIRTALTECTDKDAVKAVFERAREVVGYKAIQATRLDFENDFDDMLAQARGDEGKKRQAAGKLRFLLNKYGKLAYVDGLTDGGIDEPELSEEDQSNIGRLLAEQSKFVSNFMSKLFDEDGISDNMAESKAAMWYRGSIEPFYNAGKGSADANGMYELAGDDGEESCETCQILKGQRHRWKDWEAHELLPGIGGHGYNYVCGGWQCHHLLVRVAGRARGNWLDGLASAA